MRLILSIFLFMSFQSFSQDYYLFIGAFTSSGSKGIYVYKFNAQTGKATWVANTDSSIASNPSYLAVTTNGKYVYAVHEDDNQKNGQIAAYSFDRAANKLTFLNKVLSGGDHPCYVSVTDDNKWMAVANYTSGSAAMFLLNTDGSIKPNPQVLQQQGKSVVAGRQDSPHVHSVVFTPKQDYLFLADLGTDKVVVHKFDGTPQKPLTAISSVESAPGSGPRHFSFHPDEKFVFLMEELSGTVTTYEFDNGKLNFRQRIPAHPSDYKGKIGSADIHVSPDGKFLYASNRGDENTIAIFSIAEITRRLKMVGYQSSLGISPRNFVIDPTGNFVLVANQSTDNIVIFKRNNITGLLSATGEVIKISKPVCLKMIK